MKQRSTPLHHQDSWKQSAQLDIFKISTSQPVSPSSLRCDDMSLQCYIGQQIHYKVVFKESDHCFTSAIRIFPSKA